MFFFFRDSLAFATEPVFSCLSNVLGKYDNLPSPLPKGLKVRYILLLDIA